jgi:hypothetical protein
MSLGTTQKTTYLNIKDGKIFKDKNPYDYVGGYLKNIDLKDRDFRGETVKYWYINITSKDGDNYSLALPYYSGVAKSIINSLASGDDFSKEILIKPYLSGEYTKVVTYLGDNKLSWKTSELPNIEEVKVGDKIVKDDSKRMEFIVNLVNEINSKL